jgi:GPH family glycoside/pentoside/hexuronide:cation symporter
VSTRDEPLAGEGEAVAPGRADGQARGGPQVPVGEKMSWAAGSVADQFMTNGLNNLALPIYNISLGLSPVLIGWALFIPRIFDAVTDPVMGNISDNTRSRWGRRRLYVFFGGLGCAVCFALVWTPPTAFGDVPLFVYFLGISILYYVAYTVFAIPRQALGFELSTEYNERTTIFAMQAIFASAAGFALPWLYKLSFHPIFAGPEKNEVIGVRWVGLISAVLIIATALPGALFTRERREGQAQPRISLFRAARMTLKNRAFLIITLVVVCILVAVFLAGPMNIYINIYYVCGGDEELGAYWGGWAGTAQAGLGILAAPFIAWVSRFLGKRYTMVCGIALAIVGYFATWWLFDPERPWLQVFFMFMLQPGLMAVWVLSGSILADICDVDELEHGLRREGMFGAAYTFITKAASSFIPVLAGMILVWAGYQEDVAVSPETITNLRILFIVIPVALLSVALYLAWLFPITEEVARATRARLDERHERENRAGRTDTLEEST